MSQISVRTLSADATTLQRVAQLGPRLLAASLRSTQRLVEEAAAAFPIPRLGRSTSCGEPCEIPETECPPRCVCEIRWVGGWGEKLRCDLKVRNTSKVARTFYFSATQFSGRSLGYQVVLTPASITLQGGQTGIAQAAFQVPDMMAPGVYGAEILVRGAYEQCVCVRLDVQGEQRCECVIEQGDPPVRRRAHRWHDHFVCEEPCFPEQDWQRSPADIQAAMDRQAADAKASQKQTGG